MGSVKFCQYLGATFCLVALVNCGGGSSDSSDSSSDVTRQYRTNDNGCDSDLHVFHGSSEQDVQAQYCAGLQDQQLNHGCPTTSREDLFNKECPGHFSAHYPVASRPAPAPASSSPASGASPVPSPATPVVTQAPLPSNLEKQLTDAKSLEEIAQTLHLDAYLYRPSSRYGDQSKLTSILQSKLPLIINSKNINLQKSFLSYAENAFSGSPQFLSSLYEGLMKSTDEELATEAAGNLLALDPSKAEARTVLRKAFTSKNSEVRYNGVYYLGRSAGANLSDKLLILKATADQHADVRSMANSQSESMSLDETQLPTLKKLLESSDADVRYEAAYLMGRIDGDTTTNVLVNHLDDSNDSTREMINSKLESRTLSKNSVDPLIAKFSSANSDVRYEAAYLLGRIDGLEASTGLINQMSDSNDSVREMINSKLESRTLSDSNLHELGLQLNAKSSDTRYEAAYLLKHVGSKGAKDLLKKRLAVESNSEVTEMINSGLGL